MTRSPSSPTGPPWDPVNGFRVGALAGALVGAVLIALTGLTSFWIIAGGGAIGGAIGYRSERRRQRPSR